jgi:Interferon-induced transmembrane protein
LARTAAGWRARAAKTKTDDSPPTYFWQSLVCLILFLPTALAAVVYSILVTKRTQVGDTTGAAKASRLARGWCLVTLVAFSAAVIAALAGAQV